jgi:flagellar hook-associated protein 1 FlgK
MSGLFDSLSVASTSLNAQRMGMDLVGQNLANVNTEGYSKRQITLTERAPTDANSAGRGVTFSEITSTRDAFIQGRLTQEQSGTSMDDTVAASLSVAETSLGVTGSSLDAAFGQFFSAFAALSENPASPELRDGVARQGQALAEMFHDISDRLNTVASDADSAIPGVVNQINALATQIGQFNAQITTANGRDVSSIVDARDMALQKLSKLTDIGTTLQSSGAIDVSIGRGRALVVGAGATTMSTSNEPGTGHTTVLLGGTDITSDIHGGQLAGQIAVRDQYIPSYLDRLDTLAFEFGTAVNDLHATGTDANGDAGGDFFDLSATSAGAAGAITMSAAILGDPQLIAASSTGEVGDNGVARQIAAMRESRTLDGGTATAANLWGNLVYAVGADAAGATSSRDGRQAVMDQLGRLRDAASGVSYDEEAASLMKFQRAYEANAKFFVTVNDALDILMGMVR